MRFLLHTIRTRSTLRAGIRSRVSPVVLPSPESPQLTRESSRKIPANVLKIVHAICENVRTAIAETPACYMGARRWLSLNRATRQGKGHSLSTEMSRLSLGDSTATWFPVHTESSILATGWRGLHMVTEKSSTVDFVTVETKNQPPRTRTKSCADLPAVNRRPHMGYWVGVRSVEYLPLPVSINAGEKRGVS